MVKTTCTLVLCRVLEHEGVGCIGERKGRGEAGRRMWGG